MRIAGALALSLVGLCSNAAEPRFDIRDDILIKTPDGVTLSATLVRPSDVREPLPTLLKFTIYTRPEQAIEDGKRIAARGYASVIADARGKRLSSDRISPYEHDGVDATAVIDWIARQSWSNGKVGMWGGSYDGFSAWAAAKHRHPALKTIAVSAAAIPGLGLPMHNNVFLNANYGWAFYVTNNKLLDEATYRQNDRWRKTVDLFGSTTASTAHRILGFSAGSRTRATTNIGKRWCRTRETSRTSTFQC